MWKDRYRIGVEYIDGEHEEIFTRMGELAQLIDRDLEGEDAREEIWAGLDQMIGLYLRHFDSEERFQREIDFPYYEYHLEIHNGFRREIKSYKDRLRSLDQEEVYTLVGKLIIWLLNHMTVYDREISNYLIEVGEI